MWTSSHKNIFESRMTTLLVFFTIIILCYKCNYTICMGQNAVLACVCLYLQRHLGSTHRWYRVKEEIQAVQIFPSQTFYFHFNPLSHRRLVTKVNTTCNMFLHRKHSTFILTLFHTDRRVQKEIQPVSADLGFPIANT